MDSNTEGSPPGPGGAPRRVSGAEFSYSDPVGSFVNATRNVVFGPVGFFRGIARRGDIVNPLIFAVICAVINGLLTGILGFIVALAGAEGFGAALAGLFGGIILTPIFTAIGLFIFAAIFHLLVLLFVRPSNAGFEATFRVGAYTSVTQLLSWLAIIPIIGVLVGLVVAVFGIILGIVGIREVHSTTTGRAALVVLIPIAVLFLLGLLIALAVGAAIFFGTQ